MLICFVADSSALVLGNLKVPDPSRRAPVQHLTTDPEQKPVKILVVVEYRFQPLSVQRRRWVELYSHSSWRFGLLSWGYVHVLPPSNPN
jgi:hypothetical protein